MSNDHAHFHFGGVPVTVKPVVLGPFVLVGLVIYAVARRLRVPQPVQTTVFGTLIWFSAEWLHTAGHIVSAQLADAPMDYIEWSFAPVNGYHNHDVTPQQHVGRAAGGLAASAIGALLFWPLWRLLPGGMPKRLLCIGAIANTLLLLGGLMPIPIVDGGVIWPNLPKLRQ